VLAAKKMSITMPRGPQGHKRSADTVANAIHVAKFLTGEIEEDMGGSGKDKAAQSLGQRGANVVVLVDAAEGEPKKRGP
jgi:hypothetical protein